MGPGTDPHSANNPYADAPSPWRNFCCEAVMLCRLDEEAEGGDQPLGEFLTNLRMEVECEVLAVDKSKVSFLNLRDMHQKEVEAFWQKDIPMSLINRIQTVINDLKSMSEEYQVLFSALSSLSVEAEGRRPMSAIACIFAPQINRLVDELEAGILMAKAATVGFNYVVREVDNAFYFRDLKKRFYAKKKKQRQAKKTLQGGNEAAGDGKALWGVESCGGSPALPAYPEMPFPIFPKGAAGGLQKRQEDEEATSERLPALLSWIQVFRYRLMIRERWDRNNKYVQLYDHFFVHYIRHAFLSLRHIDEWPYPTEGIMSLDKIAEKLKEGIRREDGEDQWKRLLAFERRYLSTVKDSKAEHLTEVETSGSYQLLLEGSQESSEVSRTPGGDAEQGSLWEPVRGATPTSNNSGDSALPTQAPQTVPGKEQANSSPVELQWLATNAGEEEEEDVVSVVTQMTIAKAEREAKKEQQRTGAKAKREAPPAPSTPEQSDGNEDAALFNAAAANVNGNGVPGTPNSEREHGGEEEAMVRPHSESVIDSAKRNGLPEPTKPKKTKEEGSRKLRSCAQCGLRESHRHQFKKCRKCYEEQRPDIHYYCSENCQLECWRQGHAQIHQRPPA